MRNERRLEIPDVTPEAFDGFALGIGIPLGNAFYALVADFSAKVLIRVFGGIFPVGTEDELPVPTVLLIELEYRVAGGSGACEEIEDQS